MLWGGPEVIRAIALEDSPCCGGVGTEQSADVARHRVRVLEGVHWVFHIRGRQRACGSEGQRDDGVPER